ncbi:MAG: hypothetical protein GF329_04580 [Candidatus Lokiarchaeota archaeon]|nr:hypothetical protein [Candidatus Lokiarchaeota archaeon]
MSDQLGYLDNELEKIRHLKILPLIHNINNTRASVDFKLHIWWAKKPNNIISLIIKELSKKNDFILDPFVGSGITLHEAVKLNRNCIGLDLNRLAIFITKTTSQYYNKTEYLNLFDNILKNLKNNVYGKEKFKIHDLYLTECPICGRKSEFSYMVYDQDRPIWLRLYCEHEGKRRNIKKKTLNNDDFKLIRKIGGIKVPYWVPENIFYRNSRINIADNVSIDYFYTKRNLITLSIINHEINRIKPCPEKDLLKLTFSNILRKTSKLIGTKGGLSIAYWIPKRGRKENNPILQLIKAKNKILKNWDYIKRIGKKIKNKTNNPMIETVPVQELDSIIKDESVDLIVTDPPYGDEVPYLELSMLWTSWLKLEHSSEDFNREIVLTNSPERPDKNPKNKEGLKNYRISMEIAFQKLSDCLKDNHIACIWFQELELPIWNIMIQAAKKARLYYIEQTHVLTSIRSLKPKFTPNPTLKGHVIAFFIKISKIDKENIYNDIDHHTAVNKAEILILETAKSIIRERNGATTNELYTNEGLNQGGIISKLIKNRLLDHTSKEYRNLFKIFKKELNFNNSVGKWYLK